MAPTGRLRAVARPRSRRRRVRLDPRATPLPLPLASDHTRSRAASLPLAPDHARSGAASLPLPNLPSHDLRDPARAGPRVPLSTLPWPAGVRRLRSAVLPRVIATPGTRPSYLPADRFAPTAADPVAPTQPVPPRPPPTTAGTGYPRHHHSRAPPRATHRKPTLVSPMVPPHVTQRFGQQPLWSPARGGTARRYNCRSWLFHPDRPRSRLALLRRSIAR